MVLLPNGMWTNCENLENRTETKNGTRGVITSAADDELHRRKILVHVQSGNVITEGWTLECGDLFKYSHVRDEYEESEVLIHESCGTEALFCPS